MGPGVMFLFDPLGPMLYSYESVDFVVVIRPMIKVK
jgi:hypothetical protein